MAFLVYDDIFLQHDTGPHHPECPERLAQMTDHLRECGLWDRLTHFAPRRATAKEIDRVHAPGHLDRMRAACLATGNIDEDTRVGSYSFEAAMNAAGATLVAADAVMKGDERRGFCLVRPPGHHATSDRAMGFCLLNNVAVCAAYLLDRHGVERVAIVDIDVHHGNGTEEIFGADDRVFYLSLHRSPFYPSTGRAEDGGETLLNVPLPADTTPERWHEAFHGAMARVEAFAPEVLIVSTGPANRPSSFPSGTGTGRTSGSSG